MQNKTKKKHWSQTLQKTAVVAAGFSAVLGLSSAALAKSFAYVPRSAFASSFTFAVINTATDAVALDIGPALENRPEWVAVNHAGTRVYVSNLSGERISVINAATNEKITDINLGSCSAPRGLAVTPDDSRVYAVCTGSKGVFVIDTNTNTPIDIDPNQPGVQAIYLDTTVSSAPRGIAITPDGKKAYVTNTGLDLVHVIDTDSTSMTYNTVVGQPINLAQGNMNANEPVGIVVNPAGTRVYVANAGFNANNTNADGNVSVINTSNNAVSFINVLQDDTTGIAITPDGNRLFVTNSADDNVVAINVQNDMNTLIGNPITVGNNPQGISITPDGTKAYVVNRDDSTISIINTQTLMVNAQTISMGMAAEPVALGDFIGPELCGNGKLDDGFADEQCDDANTQDADQCLFGMGGACTDVTPGSVCGNNSVEEGDANSPREDCDDGNTQDGDACPANCKIVAQPVCGNNVVETGEQCDDGNTIAGDGCSATCQNEGSPPPPVCGNNVVETGEQCDDGNTIAGDGCSATCQNEGNPPPPVCGDGVKNQTSEQCDDGNKIDDDKCSNLCKINDDGGCQLSDGNTSGLMFLVPALMVPALFALKRFRKRS